MLYKKFQVLVFISLLCALFFPTPVLSQQAETAKYPTARFTLTQPIALPASVIELARIWASALSSERNTASSAYSKEFCTNRLRRSAD